MSLPVPATSPEPSPPHPLAPLAAWCLASLGLLALAAAGPKLWASQRGDLATLAVEITAIGQILIATIAWPIWTQRFTVALGVAVSVPAWLLVAGQLAQRSNPEVLAIAWKVAAILTLLALVRRLTRRTRLGVTWSVLAATTLGTPALLYLMRDF